MILGLLFFLSSCLSDFDPPQFPDEPSQINPVTQAYELTIVDWIVAGIEPIEVKRTYASSGARREYGGWEFWPHLKFDFHAEEPPDMIQSIVAKEGDFPSMRWIELVEPDGKKRKYSRSSQKTTLYEGVPVYEYRILKTHDDALERSKNALNNRLYIEEETDRFWVVEASGNVRHYAHQSHVYFLKYEIRPNGNLIEYKYDAKKRLCSIQTKNRSGNKTYARVEISYEENIFSPDSMKIVTSDGQTFVYTYQTFTWLNDHLLLQKRKLLEEVFWNGRPVEKYSYEKKSFHVGCFLAHRLHADGREYKIEYEEGRVSAIFVPHSHKLNSWLKLYTCQVQGVHQFNQFLPKSSEIHYIAGRRIMTFFDFEKMVICQETSDSKTLLERDAQNHLIGQTLLDQNNQLIHSRMFEYDTEHNIRSETVKADFTYVKNYHYKKGLLSCIQEERGVETEILYQPGTRLVSERILKVDEKPMRRQLFTYDEDGLLLEVIEEDGPFPTQRTYKKFIRKQQHPAIGFPEWIEEGYIDCSKNKRVLLKKIGYRYNSASQVIAEEVHDAEGIQRYRLESEYDAWGHLLKKTDPLGRESLYSYDQRGRLSEKREAGSPITFRYQYGWQGKVICTEAKGFDGLSWVVRDRYLLTERQVIRTDSYGKEVRFVFNPTGQILSCDENTFRYDPLGHLIEEKRADGTIIEYKKNLHDKPLSIFYPDGTTVSHEYEPNGALRTSTLQDGTRILIENDPLGRPLYKKIVSPKGITLSEEASQYDALHLTQQTDGNGNAHRFFYDGAGRKCREETPKSTIFYEYDPMGFLALTKMGDTQSKVGYDLLGRPVQKDSTSFFYDEYGNQQKQVRTTANGTVADIQIYDSKRRLIRHEDFEGKVESFTYEDGIVYDQNTRGTRVTHIGFDGQKRVELYDAEGLLCKRKASLEESFFYDALKRKTRQVSIAHWQGQSHFHEVEWNYDCMGRLCNLQEKSHGKIRRTEYRYDERGRLVETRKPSGKRLLKTYDSLDRLLSWSSSDHTIDYQYVYGKLAQPIEVHDLIHNTVIKREYGSSGELIHEQFPHIGSVRKVYNNQEQCVLLQLPDGSAIEYEYDQAYLREIRRKSADRKTVYSHEIVSRDTEGSPLLELLIGGLGELVSQRDPFHRLQSLTTPFMTEVITHQDRVGRTLCVNNSLFGRQEFCYSMNGSLVSEKGLWNHTYEVDGLQNRRTIDQIELRIEEFNRMEGKYDLDGNLIQWSTPFHQWNFTYDALGRLRFGTRNDGLRIEYGYDHLHRRLWKKVSCSPTLYFLYDGEREIGSMNDQLELLEFRVLRPTLSEQGAAVAIELNGQSFAPLHDTRGNVVALVSTCTKQIVESSPCSAFGENIGNFRNPWTFNSKRLDPETGLIFFGRRYYAPTQGRWITPDPAEFSDGINLYAYAKNDPVGRFDPYGLLSWGGFEWSATISYSTPKVNISFSSDNTLQTALLTSVLYSTGAAIHFIGWHAIPDVPIFRNMVLILGQILQMEKRPIDGEQFASLYLTNSLSPKNRIHVIYINGILNDSNDVWLAKRNIEAIYQTKTSAIWVPTRGFIADIVDAILSFFGACTPNTQIVRFELEKYIQEQVRREESVHLIAHSKGSILLYSALRDINPLLRKKISKVSAFGPAKLIPNYPGIDVQNFVSSKDPVPLVDLYGWFFYFATEEIHVNYLESNTFFPFDHSFLGSTYQRALRKNACGF